MQEYVLRAYQKGVEAEQVRIGVEVARNWTWPTAYSLEDLLKLHAQADFDPDTRHYCYLGEEMVGYQFSLLLPGAQGEVPSASLDFPRMLPGHEQAAELLVEKALETLKKKGIRRVVGRVTDMVPADIRLAEKMGFALRDWGYKVYYSYEMSWGKLDTGGMAAEEVDPEKDLEECAGLAARWYKRPAEWCRELLAEWHAAGVITHLGMREGGKLVAGCMAAPNTVRPSTAAIYYIYTPDERCLRALLAQVVKRCIAHGTQNVIADLINEQRPYEPVYQELGFRKAAEWARCEKELD